MHTKFNLKIQKRSIFSSNEDCIKKFGMQIPDQIQLFLSEPIINQMKRMQEVIIEEHISTIELLSNNNSRDISYAVLYREEKELEVSYFTYTKNDLKFPTVDLKSLVIICGADIDKFEVIFTYINALGEILTIRSSTFKIEE